MSEGRDPAIKLFGRTIPLPESQPPLEEAAVSGSPPVLEPADDDKDICKETTNAGAQDSTDASEDPEQCEPNCSSSLNRSDEDNRRASTQNDKATSDPKPEQDETEPCHKKTLKKPDKIVPCPRCNSLETKFCYYNNYNVNQPRHFCKNCQRYWTAGGTMRNVPVGAGRRKSKHSASHYRPMMALANEPESAQLNAPNLAHHQALPCEPSKGNCSELKFGPEAPLCESISSVLNLREQREEPPSASSPASENGSHIKQESTQGYCNGVSPIQHLPCYAGSPWVYPWGPPGWNNGIPSPVPWNGQPVIAAPAFCAPSVPFPLVPASIWGSMPGWSNSPWAVPWIGANGVMSPTSSTSNSGCSGDGSPKLGKHLRDTNSQVDEKREKSFWVPKTLRIDDPDEAAKSSIWATLGIKQDDSRGIFKAFQSKRSGECPKSDIEQAMHLNPAAFSRSQSFQEST